MKRLLDAANLLTLASLVAALACAALAINGRTGHAFVALIVSGICDLFDGFVARRLVRDDQQKEFGGTLDSLVDGCAFGFAPSVLLYCAGLTSVWEMFVLAALPVCVVWRVAKFEVVGLQVEQRERYYSGLPSTYVALVLPLVATLGFVGPGAFRIGMNLSVAGVCIAMTSSVPCRKPRGFAYIGFALLAVVVSVVLLLNGELLPSAMRD